MDQSVGATLVVPLFVAPKGTIQTEGPHWIALGSLGIDTDLSSTRNVDEGSFGHSSCESEPMCSMSDAAAASPTRAPILGAPKRYEFLSKEAAKRFPVLLRAIAKSPSVVSI